MARGSSCAVSNEFMKVVFCCSRASPYFLFHFSGVGAFNILAMSSRNGRKMSAVVLSVAAAIWPFLSPSPIVPPLMSCGGGGGKGLFCVCPFPYLEERLG